MTGITQEHKAVMFDFFSDFWKVILQSYELPDDTSSDHYWSTLVYWADALMKKYDDGNNQVVNRLVIAFLDAQSCRQYPGDSGISTR